MQKNQIFTAANDFSDWGALQLLADFAFVSSWVSECSIISEKVREHLLKNEVLRRCEGVGRLLLRHPGEAISMNKKLRKSKTLCTICYFDEFKHIHMLTKYIYVMYIVNELVIGGLKIKL